MLAPRQFGLHGALHVDKGSPQPIARRAALSEPQLDQPALAGEHLGRQLSAVFTCHGPLDAFDDGRHRRAVVFELLGAVGDLDAGAAADVLVVRTLVGVLKPAPSADVVDQDDLEVGPAVLNVGDQALQCLAAVDAQATLSFVGVGLDDLDATTRGVLTDLVALVLGRVLLMLGRHANVLGPAHSWRRRWQVFSGVVVARVHGGLTWRGGGMAVAADARLGRQRVRWWSARRRAGASRRVRQQ